MPLLKMGISVFFKEKRVIFSYSYAFFSLREQKDQYI